jgi:hypothetical protein
VFCTNCITICANVKHLYEHSSIENSSLHHNFCFFKKIRIEEEAKEQLRIAVEKGDKEGEEKARALLAKGEEQEKMATMHSEKAKMEEKYRQEEEK